MTRGFTKGVSVDVLYLKINDYLRWVCLMFNPTLRSIGATRICIGLAVFEENHLLGDNSFNPVPLFPPSFVLLSLQSEKCHLRLRSWRRRKRRRRRRSSFINAIPILVHELLRGFSYLFMSALRLIRTKIRGIKNCATLNWSTELFCRRRRGLESVQLEGYCVDEIAK